MSNVIQRVRDSGAFTLRQVFSVHTPAFPTGTWIVNPDLSTVEGGGVPKKYWINSSGDLITEMTGGEKTTIDQVILDADIANKTAAVINPDNPFDPLNGLTTNVSTAGLIITVDVDVLLVDDDTTVTADSTVSKFFLVSYEYESIGDALQLQVYERKDPAESYAVRPSTTRLLENLAEYTVAAGGSTLTPV